MTSCGSTLRAAAADDQRPLRRAEELCRLADRAMVDLGCRNRQRRLQRHRPGFAPDVDGAFEHRRSRPAAAHRTHRQRRRPRRLLRLADQRRMIDQPLDDAALVADLVQLAEAAADIGVGNLPDQAEHRRIHAIGGEQRRAGIEEPGSRHHGEGRRLAGGQRRAERHIGGALLVAGVDRAQPVRTPRTAPRTGNRSARRAGHRWCRGRGRSASRSPLRPPSWLRPLPLGRPAFYVASAFLLLVRRRVCRSARFCRGAWCLTNRRVAGGCAPPFHPLE